MENIVFDPVLHLLPDETAPRADIEAWFSTLERWAREARTAPGNWYHVTDLIVEHLGHEHFPSFQHLRALQQRFGFNVSLPLLAAFFKEVFLRESQAFQPVLEARLLDGGLIVEPRRETVEVVPRAMTERWPEALYDAVVGLLAAAGVGKQHNEPFCQALVLATTGQWAAQRQLSIAGEASLLSERDAGERTAFRAAFPLVSAPEDVVPDDIRLAWERGEQAVCLLIERAFRQNWMATVTGPLPFELGPRFLSSVRERGLLTNAVVLTKIVHIAAAVIADRAMLIKCHLHPLRETPAAVSPQRTRERDGARAWRLMLTERGAGWRMHYWRVQEGKAGRIEFSNVLKKHELEVIY